MSQHKDHMAAPQQLGVGLQNFGPMPNNLQPNFQNSLMNGHVTNNQQFHPHMGYPMLRPPIDMGNGIMPSYSHMSHQHWTSNTESMTNQTGHDTGNSVELQVEQQSPSQPPFKQCQWPVQHQLCSQQSLSKIRICPRIHQRTCSRKSPKN